MDEGLGWEELSGPAGQGAPQKGLQVGPETKGRSVGGGQAPAVAPRRVFILGPCAVLDRLSGRQCGDGSVGKELPSRQEGGHCGHPSGHGRCRGGGEPGQS